MFRYLIMLGLAMCPMLVAAGSFERVVYFVNDYDGSVIHEVSEAGSVLRSVYHAPYGGDYYRVDETPAEQTFGYAGSLVQADGLANMGYRFYDPQVGRFLSPDSISTSRGGVQHFGRYHYANNNPYAYIDEDGRDAVAIFGKRLVTAGVVSQLDSPAPGPGDAVAAVILMYGSTEYLVNVFNEASGDVPDVPDGLVGEQDDKSGQRGNRHRSGPLAPEHGGTGDAESDFEKLTGGTGKPVEEVEPGSTRPEGTLIGDNGIAYRPGKEGKGSRIDIPAKGDKPAEGLHYR